MSIKKGFNGASISKPGAYSRFKVDNSAGSDLGANDTIFLVGESTKGAPGSVTGIVEFSASRLDSLIETYGEGPLVDAAVACVRPSLTPGIGGAGKILIYKTNASTQASGSATAVDAGQLGSPSVPVMSVKDSSYGAAGNNLILKIESGSVSEPKIKAISVAQVGGTTEILGSNNVDPILEVVYTGDASTATVSIAGASRSAMTLTTTLNGDQTDGSADLSIPLLGLTISELIATIDATNGYSATLRKPVRLGSAATDLDAVTAVDMTSAVELLRVQADIRDLINTSSRVEVAEVAILDTVVDEADIALTGGAQGASANSDFSTGLSVSLAETYNVAIPCISRDAADDIADADLGTTDGASTYTIASVNVALSSHLILRGSTKNRKEAQGMIGVRESAKADAFAAIASLSNFGIQGTMQDCIFLDAQGSLRVGQPHIVAAMMAGIRLGTAVGEPLTYKFLNVQGLGHIINPVTLLESGDFNAGLDADEAIESGVTFGEKRGSGWRVVLDNTTYGRDSSFVYNRGSVVEAVYFVNKTLRELAEDFYVGKKISNGLASSLKNAVRNKLRELNQPDVQIITSSADAPEGFREATFVVTIEGNCARVKPVQGLDFVFFDFTLGDIQQTA